jgi:SAM-dependent methyltransferase
VIRHQPMAASNGRGKGPLALVSRDADAAFYTREAQQRPGPVLVLGCANGRIAWELADSGAQVLGVDPSEMMIEAAQERRQDAPKNVSDRLKLKAAPLRGLRLTERFGVVILPQNAVGLVATLEELDALFTTVAKHLEPEGTLLLDAVNPKPPELQRDSEELLPPYLEPRRPLFAPHMRERRKGGKPPPAGAIRRLKVGQFYPAELDASLERSGLKACERYGDFSQKPFDRGDPIQVVIASR